MKPLGSDEQFDTDDEFESDFFFFLEALSINYKMTSDNPQLISQISNSNIFHPHESKLLPLGLRLLKQKVICRGTFLQKVKKVKIPLIS